MDFDETLTLLFFFCFFFGLVFSCLGPFQLVVGDISRRVGRLHPSGAVAATNVDVGDAMPVDVVDHVLRLL